MKKHIPPYVNIVIECCFLLTILLHSPAAAELQLRHDPLVCVVTESPIKILFKVDSPIPPEEARIYFRKQGIENFYFVQVESENTGEYSGILPGPMSNVVVVDYLILIAGHDGQVVRSPIFSSIIDTGANCPQYESVDLPIPLVVSAEREIEPELGFSGENVIWNVSQDSLGESYMRQASETPVQPYTTGSMNQSKGSSILKKLPGGKTTAVGLGAGLGAIALIGAASGGGGSDGGSIWDPVDDSAEDVIAELVKSSQIQVSCGTIVTNQLSVTNDSTEDLMIGTIDYEVILTRDKPAGSCEPGRTGSFAPNLTTIAPPGEIAMIREWSNEVNPCSGCPYLVAECAWESRYIVHTSAGSAVAFGTFTSEGELCGTATTKSSGECTRIQGDIEP